MNIFPQDKYKYSTIAHSHHHYCSPLSVSKAAMLLQAMHLQPNALVMDAGCGKAALLRDLLALKPVRGIGIDVNASFLTEAKKAWDVAYPSSDRLTLIEDQVEHHVPPVTGYDAIMCIGSSHAFGGFAQCLDSCHKWLKPNGLLLIGESYWKQAPSDGYLAVLDATRDDLHTHAENAERAIAGGFTLLRTATSSDDDWDEYESMYCHAMMHYVVTHPEDSDARAFGERAQTWHRNYLKAGRATLGFGFYLLERKN